MAALCKLYYLLLHSWWPFRGDLQLQLFKKFQQQKNLAALFLQTVQYKLILHSWSPQGWLAIQRAFKFGLVQNCSPLLISEIIQKWYMINFFQSLTFFLYCWLAWPRLDVGYGRWKGSVNRCEEQPSIQVFTASHSLFLSYPTPRIALSVRSEQNLPHHRYIHHTYMHASGRSRIIDMCTI